MMSSQFGHQISDDFFYSATKHAVRVLCEGWRQELRSLSEENNIRIGQVSPGLVKTEIVQAMCNVDKATSDAIFEALPHLNAGDVAECVKFILESPSRMQIHDILVRPTMQKL